MDLLPWMDRDDGFGTGFVRWVGWATVLLSLAVAISLLARGVDLNPFIVGTVGFGLASGLLAARTGHALVPFVLLVCAAFPTIFGWYVFFYLPLLLLMLVGGAARLAVSLRRRAESGQSRRGGAGRSSSVG